MDKIKIRKEMLKQRKNLSTEDVNVKSNIIFNKLLQIEAFINAKNIFCYLSFNNEVQTHKIIEFSFKMNKKVYVPYIYKNTNKIDEYQNNSLKKAPQMIPVVLHKDTKFIKGDFGINIPEGKIQPIDDKEELDVIIVPGVVFDKSLNRIGFGGGYYDRFFNNYKRINLKIALAYEMQVLKSIPYNKHDVKMDYIVTEENIYNI